MAAVIRTEGLTKFYGERRGLDGLDLEVEAGEIYGYLGPNGAGKTTTIRLLLDVIRPTSGQAEVLGLDPRRDGVELRRRVGYLPGDFLVSGRQTAERLLEHLAAIRGGVDQTYLDSLIERFDLDTTVLIRSLSKGNRQKVGLIQAFMHKPDLLILDEPTSGLDPILQREFQELADDSIANGQTIFMSSHVLSEVQEVADRTGIIRDGRLVSVDRVEDLRKRAVRRVEVVFDHQVVNGDLRGISGLTDVVIDGTSMTGVLRGRADDFVKTIAKYPVTSLKSEELDLDELFFMLYTGEEESQ